MKARTSIHGAWLGLALMTMTVPAAATPLPGPDSYVYVAHEDKLITLFGHSAHYGEIGRINLATGDYSLVASTYGRLTGLAWNGSRLYAYDSSTGNLLQVDPNSGAIETTVSVSGTQSGSILTDLAFDASTGLLYGVSYRIGSSKLYTIDPGTGVATEIDNRTPGLFFREIGFAPDGRFFLMNSVANEFYRIDPLNGDVLEVIPGGAPGGAFGLDADPNTGLLIASGTVRPGTTGDRLYSVDSQTGAAVLLHDFNDGRIMSDFAFVPSLSIDDVQVTEANTGTKTLTFTVTRHDGANEVTFGYATADGNATAPGDYTAASGTGTVAAGVGQTATISIEIKNEQINEADETFTVVLSDPAGGTIADDTGEGTIVNDDLLTLTIGNATVNPEGNDPMVQTPMTFTVTRTGLTELPVTFDWGTMDGTASAGLDYVADSAGGVEIPAGGSSATHTITIQELGDALNEGNESFSVVLSNVQGATVAGTGIGTGSITDDDLTPPGLRIEDLVQAEGNAGGTVWNFPVNLSAPSGKTVTVRCRTEDQTALAGSDYTAVAAVDLVFAPGETSKLCPVTVSGDTLFESNETFRVLLSGVPGVPVNAGWQKQVAVGTITNDDASALTVSIDSQMVTEGNSGTSAMTFTVSLSAVSGTTVTVRASTVAGTALAGYANDYVNRSNILVSFLPGETSKTFVVQIVGDTVVEPTQTFNVVLSSPSVGLAIGTGTGVGTIVDNDI